MKNMTKITAAALALLAGQAAAQVEHGAANVAENDCDNHDTSVTVTYLTGSAGWSVVDAASNRGDYGFDFGTGDDSNQGVLITGNYEDARLSEACVGPDPYYATTSSARSGSSYFIAVHGSPSGAEVNWNPAFGFFPIGDGWLAGTAYNSTNGGVIDELVGSPLIPLYNTFSDPGTGNGFIDAATGQFGVRLEGIDVRRDGVMLGTGAKNEDNFVQIFHHADGTAVLNNHDNGSNGNTSEQDPVGFVFIPGGTVGVTMGVITGTGDKLFSQGDFTCELVGKPDTNGTWRIEIAGESPSTGTLLLTPTTEFRGNTIDNPVFVTPDATGWTITSRDITGMGLQDIASYDRAFHFAFFKTGVDIQPGTPDRSYLDRFDVAHAARIAVTEIRPDNGNGDMTAEREMGSDALRARRRQPRRRRPGLLQRTTPRPHRQRPRQLRGRLPRLRLRVHPRQHRHRRRQRLAHRQLRQRRDARPQRLPRRRRDERRLRRRLLPHRRRIRSGR
ncbi:MAG: hypothetical protein HND58_18205 [Planctomycetota bacterium]|nr:MAG: hypothetical protein HND58_18205 [Planctomycetota bacterium]